MSQATPIDYPGRPRVSLAGRLTALGVALGCLAVFVTAAWLKPSPTGIGTHTQLGLAPCSSIQTLGIPTPGCGMTTSFAWFVRGNLAASFYVEPMGMLLAALTVTSFWTGLYVAATGKPVYRLVTSLPYRYTLLPMLVWGTLAYGWKLYIHIHGIDGWK